MSREPHRQELARRISALIASEQFGKAQELLPRYAAAVLEECSGSDQQSEYAAARDFLKAAVASVKERRAHLLTRLNNHLCLRPYTGRGLPRSTFDVSG